MSRAAAPKLAPASQSPPAVGFRAFCESPDYCNLELSPVLGAVADAMEGLPVTLDDETCTRHFGCPASELPARAFRILAMRAGARAGKSSRLAAPLALHCAWTVPLPDLRPREIASVPIVAPDRDLASLDLAYVSGIVESSPILRSARVAETAEYVQLRRPDGANVQVRVFAASRGGRSVRGKSLAGAILDECSFFLDSDSGEVNDRDILQALLPRVVAGGRILLCSTPWLAGVGILEDHIKRDFGQHTRSLAITADTMALRPDFDPTGEIRADMRENDPDAYRREILAEPLAGGNGAFFDSYALERSIDQARPLELAPVARTQYFAGCDWGLRSDSSALCIVALRDGIAELAHFTELQPKKGEPLKASYVVDTFAEQLRRYGIREVLADLFFRDSIEPELHRHGIKLVPAPGGGNGKAETHVALRTRMNEGRVRLPNAPRLIQQLRAIVSKPAPGGGLVISSPRSRVNGHGDVASALVLATYACTAAWIESHDMGVESENWDRGC